MMNTTKTINDTQEPRWSVRRILEEECKYPYALMYLSVYGIWTDRVYCEDELSALHICDLLNLAEEHRDK